MNKHRRLAAASLATALAFTACAGKHASHDQSADKNNAPMSDRGEGQVAKAVGGDVVVTKEDARFAADGPTNHEEQDGRKVIRTGRIELLVPGYDDARDKIDALVKAAGGYVDSTNVNRRQDAISDATIVVRMPKAAFGNIVPKLKEIGEVLSESTNASDITDQYVDISARLASARTLEKRLLELATDKHGNIDQVLSVERELARVRGEIEGYEGHLRQWNDQIDMSTLTLSIQTKRPEIVAAPVHEPTLGERTSHAWSSSIDSLRDAGTWLVVNGIAFLPWLVLLIPGGLLGRRLLARLWRRLPVARALPPSTPAEPPPAA
jgi:hypothetical protein